VLGVALSQQLEFTRVVACLEVPDDLQATLQVFLRDP